ncbi:DUF655 domain-containing protein [Halomarina halobia]|uniref:DUF655 domain-containing protein n=1 Tax=Halomarina halobia TaxID=3033386 RepID=A0ABD6A6A9_9EURY|nr:DUF655 domain-containing protein [Halomarina sp. PSR21]
MTDPDSDTVAVVLDYLPHGRADDDRPQYQKPSLALALGVDDFGLYECVLAEGADLSIGDRFSLSDDAVESVRGIDYDDLSGGGRSELKYAVEGIVDEDERRFVDHYNEAQPITLRLHQLNLLPGIGKKLRNSILEERKRKPFESFEELDERVKGLHDPRGILVERIMEEIREEDLKYRSFVR